MKYFRMVILVLILFGIDCGQGFQRFLVFMNKWFVLDDVRRLLELSGSEITAISDFKHISINVRVRESMGLIY